MFNKREICLVIGLSLIAGYRIGYIKAREEIAIKLFKVAASSERDKNKGKEEES